jgi:competence protein ComEC
VKFKSLRVLLISVVFILFISPVQAATLKFKDVTPNNSHFNGIYTLEKEGIINGYPAVNGKQSFKPDRKITRSQTAELLRKALNLQIPSNVDAVLKNYKDISSKHDYANAIAATNVAGIFKGSNGKFNDGPLTREQMATVLVNSYNLKDNGKPVNAYLSNVDPSHRDNVKILFQYGITNQIDNFRPTEAVTRGQFATFLYRAIQQTEGKYKEMEAHFIDVGQGDSILIQTPNGKNILIDGGRKSAGTKVVDYLTEHGVKSIDLLVATHPDADHIGGLVDVLQQVPVKNVLDSGRTHTTETYMEYLELIDQKNITFNVAKVGSKLTLDNDLTITVLNALNPNDDINDSSVVLKISYGTIDFLLTGDASIANEKSMIQQFNVKAEILKAGHHGSDTSSSAEFIRAVAPEATILSYGENNYGHPDPTVVQRLQNIGSSIYSTYSSGDIVVTANGVVYRVSASPWKGGISPVEPSPTPIPVPKPEPKPEPEVKYPINVNTANYDTLLLIKGVGPTIAQNIIDYRKAHGPFTSINQLLNVKYIGEATLNEMKPYITL